MLASANLTAVLSNSDHCAYAEPGDAPGKRAILCAAIDLFASKGVDGTSIRDIGESSGLTNPALFRHFAGKESLGSYLFERIFRRFRSSLPEIDSSPFSPQLAATLAAYLRFFDEDLRAALFFQDSLRRFWPQLPASLRRRSLIAHMRALLDVGVSQGIVDPNEDLQLLQTATLGFLAQFARQLYFKETASPAANHLQAIHRLILRTLTCRAVSRARPWRIGK
jgi:AcrR family transcriptional regulator